MYGADIDNYGTVVNAAKRYPMMAPRQLVVVKEAQQVANIELLSFYLKQPLASTILVINHKHGVVKSKKLLSEIEQVGVLYESKNCTTINCRLSSTTMWLPQGAPSKTRLCR